MGKVVKRAMAAGSENLSFFPQLSFQPCFGCSPTNEKGLRLKFYQYGPDQVCTNLVPSFEYVGWENFIHGGIISTILDEVMMWSILRFEREFYITVEMTTRFRKPVIAGEPITASAWHHKKPRPNLILLQGKITPAGQPETVLAEAEGLFARVPEDKLSSAISPGNIEEYRRLFAHFAALDWEEDKDR